MAVNDNIGYQQINVNIAIVEVTPDLLDTVLLVAIYLAPIAIFAVVVNLLV